MTPARNAESVFWQDHAEDMKDPEYREAFERTSAELSAETVTGKTVPWRYGFGTQNAGRRLPRWCHRLFAFVRGYYWAPCPRCGRWYGGHEVRGSIPTDEQGVHRLTCCPPYCDGRHGPVRYDGPVSA